MHWIPDGPTTGPESRDKLRAGLFLSPRLHPSARFRPQAVPSGTQPWNCGRATRVARSFGSRRCGPRRTRRARRVETADPTGTEGGSGRTWIREIGASKRDGQSLGRMECRSLRRRSVADSNGAVILGIKLLYQATCLFGLSGIPLFESQT